MTTFYTPVNNARGSLSIAHAIGSGTLVLRTGEGAYFGSPSPSAPIRVTVVSKTTMVNGTIAPTSTLTIFQCTGRTTDTLTGLTVIEGTSDHAYVRNDVVVALITAGALTDIHAAIAELPVDASVMHKTNVAETVLGTKTFTGTLTTLTSSATGTLKTNRFEMGVSGVGAEWAIPVIKFWDYAGAAPISMGCNGPNPYNGVQDDVLYWGYNVGPGGAKWVPGQSEIWYGMEFDVLDDADSSGAFVGLTRNYEINLNSRPENDLETGIRWMQFRGRRGMAGSHNGLHDHGQWVWTVAGQYGGWTIHESVAGNSLFHIDISGNTGIRGDVAIGTPSSGVPATGNLDIGGRFTSGGDGGIRWGVSGLGYPVSFDGAGSDPGVVRFLQWNDASILRVVPFTDNTSISAPAIEVTKSDQTTLAVGLGQGGIQMSGTIRRVGSGTLSGFGGYEDTSLAGVGAGYASPAYYWYSGSGATELMHLDSSGLSLAGSLAVGKSTAPVTPGDFHLATDLNLRIRNLASAPELYAANDANSTYVTLRVNGSTLLLNDQTTGNVGIGGGSFGAALGALFLANATTVPSGNPSGGGLLYIQDGALKYRGSSGTITTIANA